MFSAPSTSSASDATFTTEVPHDLTCVICQLALREPKQIMQCGHRFCGVCFDGLVSYAKHLSTELLCPVDRKLVNIAEVFNDNGAARSVRNLEVKCSRHEVGCKWSGTLGDVDEHNSSCQYRSNVSFKHKGDTTNIERVYEDLLQRVAHCEEESSLKEKELAHLKFNVRELKEECVTNKEEMKKLKEANTKLESEMEKESITNQKDIIELKETIKQLQNTMEEESIAIKEVKEANRKHLNEIASLKEQNTLLDRVVRLNRNRNATSIERTTTEIRLVKDRLVTLENVGDIDLKNFERKLYEAHALLKDLEEKSNGTDGNLKNMQEKLIETDAYLKNVECKSNETDVNLRNVENVLYLHDFVEQKCFKFKWVLQNYQYHFDKGVSMCSPIFLSQVLGYQIRLYINWNGTQKENMAMGLFLYRGKNKDGFIPNLPTFNLRFILEHLGLDGVKTRKLMHNGLQSYKDGLSIPDGDNGPSRSVGFTRFLIAPYDQCIIDDSLYLTCTMLLG